MAFGGKLKKLREQRNLLQEDLASVLGCSRKTVSAYERGIREPNMSTISKIAEFFGVTTDYLLGEKSEVSTLEDEFPDGVQILRRANKELSNETKRKMIKLMEAFLEKE